MIRLVDPLVVALDVPSEREAQILVSRLGASVHIYKVGMGLFTAGGPQIVRNLLGQGKKVFLDLKYHDIPNTVAAAVRVAARLKVSMLTVHAVGGLRMLQAASKAARESGADLKLLAVTVLTSMDDEEMQETGIRETVKDQVVRLTSLALNAGCDGVVSSAQEVRLLRAEFGHDFLAVTPGVRPQGSAQGDQSRVVTPAQAIAAGATHIVVGRPIIAAPDPAEEAERIVRETAIQPIT